MRLSFLPTRLQPTSSVSLVSRALARVQPTVARMRSSVSVDDAFFGSVAATTLGALGYGAVHLTGLDTMSAVQLAKGLTIAGGAGSAALTAKIMFDEVAPAFRSRK